VLVLLLGMQRTTEEHMMILFVPLYQEVALTDCSLCLLVLRPTTAPIGSSHGQVCDATTTAPSGATSGSDWFHQQPTNRLRLARSSASDLDTHTNGLCLVSINGKLFPLFRGKYIGVPSDKTNSIPSPVIFPLPLPFSWKYT
jgi:hypothetical protein